MPHLPNPNPVRPGPGPEKRLRNLQRRFRAVSARHDRAIKLRRIIKATLTAIVAFAVTWGLGSSPWPVTTTLRHIASAPNCDFARLVGLAPARWGEPGYWKHHDRDGDGVACEPWPPRGSASLSAVARYRGRRSDACRTRDNELQLTRDDLPDANGVLREGSTLPPRECCA
jgi:Excalibur calcium-binding domain